MNSLMLLWKISAICSCNCRFLRFFLRREGGREGRGGGRREGTVTICDNIPCSSLACVNLPCARSHSNASKLDAVVVD